MVHITNNTVKLQLTPTYNTRPPKITVDINGHVIFDGDLIHAKSFDQSLMHGHSLQIKIKRSGRTKSIINSDPENGFIISNLAINGVNINPDIGSYQCTNNDYIETHTVHGKHFTLNGKYCLEIPYYTLRGQITKNKGRFDITGQHHKYCFFGASMTDYDFTQGIPPIHNKKNYADLFIQHLGGVNLSSSGQTNQEVFETVYKYLENNKSDVVFAQLISIVGRQVKNQSTKEIRRYSPHTDGNLDWVDEFTKSNLKNIQECFVYLDIAPILALQIPEYQKLIAYAEDRGSKIFFISYFRDEYDIMKQVIPNNMAPYFDIDPNTKYCKDNGYHATPEEQENYSQSLVDFIRKIT
jgi:hypothetical protein